MHSSNVFDEIIRNFLRKIFRKKQEAPERDDDTISIDKITEVDESKTDEINTKFSTYLAEGTETGRRPPFYCKELGFAMEKIKDGFTLKDLWEVIPSTNWKFFKSLLFSYFWRILLINLLTNTFRLIE